MSQAFFCSAVVISPHTDMFAVCTLLFLCLLSASHSAPLDCKDVLRPLDGVDPSDLQGRWAMVADSLRIIQSPEPFTPSSSIVLDLYNSSITKANRISSSCYYDSYNVTLRGSNFQLSGEGMGGFSGSIFHTTCPDCVVLSFNVESHYLKSQELCLFSRRRQLEQRELQEFMTQVKCLNLPEPYVMDPNEELCPPYQKP